jgi:hypothetical protein
MTSGSDRNVPDMSWTSTWVALRRSVRADLIESSVIGVSAIFFVCVCVCCVWLAVERRKLREYYDVCT